MEAFIEDFNITDGCVTSINKEYSEEMIFERFYNGTEIESIGNYSCNYGKATVVNLYNTSIKIIGEYAFAYCPLTEIIFPESLETIHKNAFLLSSLPYIYIPANVDYLSSYAFNLARNINYFNVSSDNSMFTSVNGFLMDSNKTIILHAPRNATNEKDFPYHERIDVWAFCGASLESYIANSSLKTLAVGAFCGTEKLILLDLSKSEVTSIPKQVFQLSTVKTLILPENLQSIESDAFSTKNNFRRLIIPASCTQISPNTFKTPEKLTIIYFGSTDFSRIDIFSSNFSTVKVYVTPYYYNDQFGYVKVFRNWINEPMTCHSKHFSVHSYLIAIFLYTK